MRHNQIIYLISVDIIEDELCNQIEKPTERMVFANEYSVSSTEHYNAALVGLRPSKVFEIYSFEYQNEKELEHNGETYDIIRTGSKGEKVLLTCEVVAGNG